MVGEDRKGQKFVVSRFIGSGLDGCMSMILFIWVATLCGKVWG